jgi:hypothetical protein
VKYDKDAEQMNKKRESKRTVIEAKEEGGRIQKRLSIHKGKQVQV